MQIVHALHTLGLPTATLVRLAHIEESELRRVALGHAVLDPLGTISLVAFAVRWCEYLEQFAANSPEVAERLVIATPLIERAQHELLRELTGLNPEQQLIAATWKCSWISSEDGRLAVTRSQICLEFFWPQSASRSW